MMFLQLHRSMFSLCLLLVVLSFSPQVSQATTIREALLCEAEWRFKNWYGNESLLDWPKERDGVTLRITKTGYPCGGDGTAALFGRFELDEATPEDLFNALTDVDAQAQWDVLIGKVTFLGDFKAQQARGMAISFVAHPFADREVYQWQAVNTTDPNDLWVVFSTRANEVLHAKKPTEHGAVATQNCLGAYRVRRKANGGCSVTFTSQVNSHPWLLSASFVFNLMWGKTVDYINALSSRAKLLAKKRGSAPGKIGLPDWMMQDEPPAVTNQQDVHVVPPFAICYAPGTEFSKAERQHQLLTNDKPTHYEIQAPEPLPSFLPKGMEATGTGQSGTGGASTFSLGVGFVLGLLAAPLVSWAIVTFCRRLESKRDRMGEALVDRAHSMESQGSSLVRTEDHSDEDEHPAYAAE
eukprot:TRINITY_DN43278_c0_g1_i1.p1 TRINITY_DN43278_c0_g1~~TRINITY_DN43278_c0_g1_i1.p1  ORF type:complete len:410 (+),score=59.43 TRINITY_DN43278_c0_g1_i1:155-1384(+)